MTDSIAQKIFIFLDDGGDFETGLALLSEVKPNTFYISNLRRKGGQKAMDTLKYELRKSVSKFERVQPVQIINKDAVQLLEAGKFIKIVQEKEEEKTETFVLRKEFPFLEREDCPEEFKIMVADMITAHQRYITGHERLYYMENKSEDECFAEAQNVVENYLDNRHMWEELEHYKKTGAILGKHRLFWKRKREEELSSLEPIALANLYRNYPRNINYYNKRISEEKDSDQVFTWKERLSVLQWEHKIVKRLLHIHDSNGKLRRNKAGKTKKTGRARKCNSHTNS